MSKRLVASGIIGFMMNPCLGSPRPRGPRAPWPLGCLVPDQWVDSVADVDPRALAEQGIRGLLVDIDNTLVAWDAAEVGEAARDLVRRCREAGVGVMLLSNARAPRRQAMARALGVPAAPGPKPLRRSFLRAAARAGWRPHEVAVVGDQLWTDVLGARRAGMRAILVNPISRREHLLTRWVRRLERLALRVLVGWGVLERQALERREGGRR